MVRGVLRVFTKPDDLCPKRPSLLHKALNPVDLTVGDRNLKPFFSEVQRKRTAHCPQPVHTDIGFCFGHGTSSFRNFTTTVGGFSDAAQDLAAQAFGTERFCTCLLGLFHSQ
jgi:hypothetical protein